MPTSECHEAMPVDGHLQQVLGRKAVPEYVTLEMGEVVHVNWTGKRIIARVVMLQ